MSSTIFPSSDTWIIPRMNGGIIDTTNCEIILNQKIDKIDKVLICPSNVKIAKISGSNGESLNQVTLSEFYLDENHTKPIILDVTNYVVEKAKFNTLQFYGVTEPIPWGEVKLNNAWYYEHNGNSIVLLNTRKNIFSGYIPANIIQFALYDLAVANDGLYFKNSGIQDFTAKVTAKNISSIHSDSFTTNLLTMQFRVYYTPLGESVKLQVPKTNPKANQFCIPYSQQQPIVDNVTLGREMQSVANRAGCEKKEVVRTIHSINDKRKLGTIYREKDDDGNFKGNIWRLTGERTSIYSDT